MGNRGADSGGIRADTPRPEAWPPPAQCQLCALTCHQRGVLRRQSSFPCTSEAGNWHLSTHGVHTHAHAPRGTQRHARTHVPMSPPAPGGRGTRKKAGPSAQAVLVNRWCHGQGAGPPGASGRPSTLWGIYLLTPLLEGCWGGVDSPSSSPVASAMKSWKLEAWVTVWAGLGLCASVLAEWVLLASRAFPGRRGHHGDLGIPVHTASFLSAVRRCVQIFPFNKDTVTPDSGP